ncbi:MAG: FtsW/RodA/SpoVE family cell cycle protein [Kiritimatiellae bacterium]|nr:FtsW/RodA/SpoVE family cell cycle protein [Kiritimatiellia bacterium]
MISKILKFNWITFLSMVALAVIGVVFIKSAGEARTIAALQGAWRVHAATAFLGLIVYFTLAFVDYRKILDLLAVPYFWISVILLVAVLAFGAEVYGGKRWLWFFQPSEIAKPAVILMIAKMFGSSSTKYNGIKGLLLGMAILLVPALLILAEPDLGTALVLVPTVVVMLVCARICLRVLVPMLLSGLVCAGLVLGAVYKAENTADLELREKIYRYLPLKKHQRARLRTFINPDADPYGSGWNLRQSMISIGSGSISGKGIGKGEQKSLQYLPPSVSMNDFIFCVLAEETGFVGSATVLVLFLMLLLSGLWTAVRSNDDRGRLVVIGVTTLVFVHIYINIAMSIGLMPITGLPLPFISAGKTFLVVLLASLGIVQSISLHREEKSEEKYAR